MSESSDAPASNPTKDNDLRLNDEGAVVGFQWTASGASLYGLIRNTLGYVYDTTTDLWAIYSTANLANYAIALVEDGTASQYYKLSIPQKDGLFLAYGSGTTRRNVRSLEIAVYAQVGASPAEGDTAVDVLRMFVEATATNEVNICRPRSIVNESVDSWPMNGTINQWSFPGLRKLFSLQGQTRRPGF